MSLALPSDSRSFDFVERFASESLHFAQDDKTFGVPHKLDDIWYWSSAESGDHSFVRAH